ncbi:hypothetical protein SAMN04488515_3000 [Cognatiyoonia koreensis]|uniref:Uncharacterized protein n=1 Tax=Cognatiyoonia koreensis TaxID=364200 RepID=A0A1I0RNF9_9RHOB|nr:hypothetical protein [Cognatiyoonia koreensis]SEW42780.1 hypothetical protein SAMN04488515_3000 [Cognatiyoonia koreensis]
MTQVVEAMSGQNDPPDGVKVAFQTVEASLRAENWFFETVRAELEKTAPLCEFPTIMGSNGHDYLLHFTQFLFFLKALDCTDADAIAHYIETHNARIESLLKDPNFAKSKNEFRKAIFRPERKAKVLDTVRTLSAPVFAIYEFAHLLIDEMSPKTTEKLIEDLRFGGLLSRRTDNRMSADQKRILISSTGFLENTYSMSLLMQRRMVALTLSEDEFRRAKA